MLPKGIDGWDLFGIDSWAKASSHRQTRQAEGGGKKSFDSRVLARNKGDALPAKDYIKSLPLRSGEGRGGLMKHWLKATTKCCAHSQNSRKGAKPQRGRVVLTKPLTAVFFAPLRLCVTNAVVVACDEHVKRNKTECTQRPHSTCILEF
jgi:hypothetical protein